jgi:hypothetical protein
LLRDRAQKELGSKFDIRSFHDEMLNGGVLPLDLLDSGSLNAIRRLLDPDVRATVTDPVRRVLRPWNRCRRTGNSEPR